MMMPPKLTAWLLVLTTAGFLSGCGTLARDRAVPPELHGQEHISDMPGVRYQALSKSGIDKILNDIKLSIDANKTTTKSGVAHYLSISGGGDNGAFGAGLLTGWTERGDRPTFDLVTGVSTGALIAPFAYLGPAYDPVLKTVYTETQPSDIYLERGLLGALFGEAIGDTTPLFKLISKHIDADLLKAIAEEYSRSNRWLLVATTNLDTGTPVIWNLGKLAQVGTPEALALFRKILLASAAIPGVFPPVMIDVVANGKNYQEMHVDGGATMSVFLYPAALGEAAITQKVLSTVKKRKAYIIRNARIDADWQEIERDTLSIMGRAVAQLIQSQGYGDLYRIYQIAQRDHVEFNLAYIGADFKFPHEREFDRQYMNALYQYGLELGKAGYPWVHTPPGFNAPIDVETSRQTKRNQEARKRIKTVKPAEP
jgi:predicted acylesterase/phospholipase RssA